MNILQVPILKKKLKNLALNFQFKEDIKISREEQIVKVLIKWGYCQIWFMHQESYVLSSPLLKDWSRRMKNDKSSYSYENTFFHHIFQILEL